MTTPFTSLVPLTEQHATALLAALVLSLLGIPLVVRNRLFAAAALSHASALGLALAAAFPFSLEAADWLGARDAALLLAVGLAIVLALGLQRLEVRHESFDALCAWLLVGSTAASLLLVAGRPTASGELQALVTSSELRAGTFELATLAAVAVFTIAWLATSRRKLLLFTIDEPMAEAVGMRTAVWAVALAIVTGTAVGSSLCATGLLFTFSFLVLPATAARSLCRELGSWFAVAPALALGSVLSGFAAAGRYDLPPAETAVAVQAAALIPVWLLHRRGGRRAQSHLLM